MRASFKTANENYDYVSQPNANMVQVMRLLHNEQSYSKD